MRILLIRHGETDLNKERRFQGRKDYPLNEEGIKQAEIISKFLKDIKIDKIISSPLQRAVKTAEIINRYHKLKIELEELTLERDFGKLDGKKYEEVVFKKDDPLFYKEKNIETKEDFLKRVKKLIEKIKQMFQENKNKNKTIVITTHGGIIKILLAVILNIDYYKAMTQLRISNCSITELEIKNKDEIIVKNINYLPEELLKKLKKGITEKVKIKSKKILI